MTSEVKKFYEFGKFRFDAQKLHLEYDGETVQLPPKALETLKILLEEKGEIILRENFLDKVWGESFVEDANLTVAISTLRKALAAFDKNRTFIQTVPGRGYRFVGEAQERIEVSEQPIIIQRHRLEHLKVEQTSPKRFSRVFVITALVGLIASATTFAVWFGRGKSAHSAQNANPAAEAFQKGDALLQKRQVCESIPYFREAIAKDENHASSYSSLAAALAMCGVVTEEIDEAIAKSLSLDSNLSEAHATDGFIKLFRRWDWDGAEAALRRAIALDPNSAKAHHWLGVCLSIRGRLLEAQGEMKRAIEIAPNSPLYYADLCQVYYFQLHSAAALNYCQKAQEIDPNFIFTPVYLRDIYLLAGDEQKAFEYQAKDWLINGWSPEAVKQSEKVFRRGGFKALYKDGIRHALNEIKLNSARGAATSLDLAHAYAGLRDRENTMRWLEKVIRAPKGTVPFGAAYLGVLPHYAFLRNDPRFQTVLQEMNLRNGL